MAKIEVSMATYGEIFSILKRQGKEINDGMALTIEKGTAIVPPVDFRIVALRQNVLDACSKAYIAPIDDNDYEIQDDDRFVQFCERVYQWCWNGKIEKEDKSKSKGEW